MFQDQFSTYRSINLFENKCAHDKNLIKWCLSFLLNVSKNLVHVFSLGVSHLTGGVVKLSDLGWGAFGVDGGVEGRWGLFLEITTLKLSS